MNEERWYLGLVRLGDTLYAVGGCGQLDTIEALRLAAFDHPTSSDSNNMYDMNFALIITF